MLHTFQLPWGNDVAQTSFPVTMSMLTTFLQCRLVAADVGHGAGCQAVLFCFEYVFAYKMYYIYLSSAEHWQYSAHIIYIFVLLYPCISATVPCQQLPLQLLVVHFFHYDAQCDVLPGVQSHVSKLTWAQSHVSELTCLSCFVELLVHCAVCLNKCYMTVRAGWMKALLFQICNL